MIRATIYILSCLLITLFLLQFAFGIEDADGNGGIENGCDQLLQSGTYEGIVLQRVKIRAKKFAHSNAPVIILGPTGIGKTTLAFWIHQQSGRNGPFKALNVAAFPRELVESELFGHKKGAFTGAVADYLGLVRAAAGGTLFLDEIGDLPPDLQAKILRFIETHKVRPVGHTEEFKVDVRLITATHQNIKAQAQLEETAGRANFRADLYYRLGILDITIPPIRGWGEEVLPLADHLLTKIAIDLGREFQFSPEAKQKIIKYNWPGNVRELNNIILKAALLAESGEKVISPELLEIETPTRPTISTPPTVATVLVPEPTPAAEEAAAPGLSLPKKITTGKDGREFRFKFPWKGKLAWRPMLELLRRAVITEALRDAHGKATHAAREANIKYHTFFAWYKGLGIDPQHYFIPASAPAPVDTTELPIILERPWDYFGIEEALERFVIYEALRRTKGVARMAADLLETDAATIVRRAARLKIPLHARGEKARSKSEKKLGQRDPDFPWFVHYPRPLYLEKEDQYKRGVLELALTASKGVIKIAAKRCKVGELTFAKWCRKLDIDPQSFINVPEAEAREIHVPDYHEGLAVFQRQLLTEVLTEFGGVIKEAGKKLGISEKTAYDWIKGLGIDPQQFAGTPAPTAPEAPAPPSI